MQVASCLAYLSLHNNWVTTNMAIEITSLFRDILESPEQKQQRQMAEGFARSQNAVSQLTGLATAAAPLVGTMAELQGQRNEMLQRGAGRLLGRDVRSTSEKLQSALSQFNPQDPASVSQTTQMLQQMGLGAQGAQLAAMALEEQQRKEAVDLQAEAARQTIDLNQAQEKRAVTNQEMAVAEEKRAVLESAARLKMAELAYDQAGTQEERDAAKAARDEQLSTLSQLNIGLDISQRGQEEIDRQARESSRESNAASLRNMGTAYEPLAILMETPGSDVVGVMSQAATLSANLLRSSAEDYKTLTKDEQLQAMTFVDLLGEENPLAKTWYGSRAVPPAQLYNQVAIARRMNPNAGMEQWVATAAAQIKTGIAQALENNADTVIENMPGVNSQASQPAPLTFDVNAIAASIAPAITNPPVPIPATVAPSVNGVAQRPSLPSNVPGRSDDVRQAEVAALLTNLTAKNNSDRAAGKPFKTQQELQVEARTRVNQKYSQGN
jgi:hypothetical protein